MTDLAGRLLDAHVAHELSRLTGGGFADMVRGEVEHALGAASQLTLDDVMHRDQVASVAVKYVAAFRLPGAIPEIVSAIAASLRTHPANGVALKDLVERARVEEVITAVTQMRSLRERLLRGLADSTALQAGVGDIVHGLAAGAIGTGRNLLRRVPILSQGVDLAGAMAAPVTTPVGAALDQRSRELAEHGAKVLLGYLGENAATGVSDAELRTAVLEVWDALSTRPVGELLSAVGDDDIVDLFLALYDLWSDLRTSEYVTALVESGVGVFFDTYGATTLDVLLEEFGLGPDDLVEEALRFAPSVLEALRETGLLAAGIRRHLARFYESAEAQALLA